MNARPPVSSPIVINEVRELSTIGRRDLFGLGPSREGIPGESDDRRAIRIRQGGSDLLELRLRRGWIGQPAVNRDDDVIGVRRTSAMARDRSLRAVSIPIGAAVGKACHETVVAACG